MSDSNYTYSATSRIPIRPLSIENKDLALPRELLMDYTNAKIYICDISGTIVDITTKMLNQTNEMIKENLKSNETESTIKNVDIELDDGTIVTIENGIVQLFNQIRSTNENFNTFSQSIIKHIDEDIVPTIPTASTDTPKASAENGSIGTQKKVFALGDHIHPKGLATVADSAKSVEWENVQNHPDFSESDHNHDTIYYKKSGDLAPVAEVALLNNKGLYGYTTANAKAYIAYIDTSNRIHIGHQNGNPIILDAKLILNSDNYGEADPSTSGAVIGQMYLQLI